MRTVFTIALIFLSFSPAAAQQTEIPDFATARDKYFWAKLYAAGGATIYCNHIFPSERVFQSHGGLRVSISGEELSVEHIYSAEWIAEAHGCSDRDHCDVPAYHFAEADLHNLWPALKRIYASRSDLPVGELPGESSRRFTEICEDFERSSGPDAVVEPQPSVKGDVARSLLYMMVFYDLPVHGSLPVLLSWHKQDPPDDAERWRNTMIEELQGTRNPFIDYPMIVRLVDLR
jgi:deoxyribonuclease-1